MSVLISEEMRAEAVEWVATSVPRDEDELERRFHRLVTRWREERGPSSLERDLAMHPAYQAIISKGEAVLPLIFEDLERTRDRHWFWALRVITDNDPVPEQIRGKVPEMMEAWVRWGEEHGYLPYGRMIPLFEDA